MGSVLLVTLKATNEKALGTRLTNEEFVLPLKELSDPLRKVLVTSINCGVERQYPYEKSACSSFQGQIYLKSTC